MPVAAACILGALTLFSGPTGIASIGALLVTIGPLRTILHRRSAQFGLLPLLAPLLAAVTVTAILIFRDQTFAGEMQASSFKSPSAPAWPGSTSTSATSGCSWPARTVHRPTVRGADSAHRARRFGGNGVAARQDSGNAAGPS